MNRLAVDKGKPCWKRNVTYIGIASYILAPWAPYGAKNTYNAMVPIVIQCDVGAAKPLAQRIVRFAQLVWFLPQFGFWLLWIRDKLGSSCLHANKSYNHDSVLMTWQHDCHSRGLDCIPLLFWVTGRRDLSSGYRLTAPARVSNVIICKILFLSHFLGVNTMMFKAELVSLNIFGVLFQVCNCQR